MPLARVPNPSRIEAVANPARNCSFVTLVAMSAPLPAPASSFAWKHTVAGPLLQCAPLLPTAQHGFTTSQLKLPAGAGSEAVAWRTLAQALGTEPASLARVRQVHGCSVHIVQPGGNVTDAGRNRPDADAIASAIPGAALAVVTADCVPVLLSDPDSGAVAAVHAGWRGTCGSIVESTVKTMTERFGTELSRLVAAIGPSIGPCCYAVGAEVREAFVIAGHPDAALDRWFTTVDGTLRLDLWTANRDQLEHAGVSSGAIFTCRLCTATERETFPSYRVAGAAAGRMAAVIVAGGLPQARSGG